MSFETLQEIGSFGIRESIEFAYLEGDAGEGYDSSTFIGHPSGTREWILTWKVLPQSMDSPITYNGMILSRADYLWEFFCQRKREGNSSFIIKSPRNNQYYLAKFVDTKLTYEMFMMYLYTTGLALKQRRESGVTVFDPLKIPNLWAWYDVGQETGLEDNDFLDIFTDFSGNGNHCATNDEIHRARYKEDIINGFPSCQWQASNSASYSTVSGVTLRHLFIVTKFGATTFSGNEGLVSDVVTHGLLAGGGNTATEFYDFNFTGEYEYRLNDKVHPQNAQPAPMNQFGLINVNTDGVAWSSFQVGRDRDFSDRYYLGDVPEIIVCDEKITKSWVEEINEYLMVKYGFSHAA